jgi:hypothetical protein
VNRFVLVVVGVVFQPEVIHNYRWPDIVCLEVYTFLLCPKIVPKTKYEIPLPSLLLYKLAEDVKNRILGIKG